METRASVDANGCGVHVDITDQILVLGVMKILVPFREVSRLLRCFLRIELFVNDSWTIYI
jgi:hypothetical protein